MRGYYERDDEAIRQSKLEDKMKEKARKLKLENISHLLVSVGKQREASSNYTPSGLPTCIIHGDNSNNEEIREIIGLAWLKNDMPAAARFFALGEYVSIGSYRLDFYHARARAVQFYEQIGGEDEKK